MTINLNKIISAIAMPVNSMVSKCRKVAAKIQLPNLKSDVFESSDLKTLEAIKNGVQTLRDKKKCGGLLLSYGYYTSCDIPYQKGNFYRAIGSGGYDDFCTSGLLRGKQNAKFKDIVYFDIDAACSKYAQGKGGEYIAETNSQKLKNVNGFYAADCINSQTDKIRIWKRMPDSKHYEIVFDTMDDIISRHPDFRV